MLGQRCSKCGGNIVPMDYPDERVGVRCFTCGRHWYRNPYRGKEMREIRLPSTGKDTYTSSDSRP